MGSTPDARATVGGPRPGPAAGFSLLEVLVALAIVAIAVFPMMEITQRAEASAFDAKFTSLACSKIRSLLSSISATAAAGDFGEGDLSSLTDEKGYDPRFAFANVLWEWQVDAVDLSSDLLPEETAAADGSGTDSGQNPFTGEDTAADERTDDQIDERFLARYVRITMYYELENGEQQELTVETLLPPLPKKPGAAASRVDSVPPNRGS